MSQLIINRMFKPSVCKKFLRQTNVRLFSSATHTSGLESDDKSSKVNQPFSSKPAFPFLLIDYILNNPNSSSDGRVTTNDYCSNEKEVLIKDKDLKEEVCDAMTVGFSRDGLRVKLCDNYDDSLCSPTIFYKPTDPELEDVTVYLPPLATGSQIQSLAMSSLPKRDKNWVVVVKLLGSQLSMCRPFGSRKWINIKTKPQNINPLSSIMFSKKDKKFYIPTPGGNILCYLDPYSEDDDQIDFLDLDFDDLPESVFQELADVSTCSRTDHLVESPTGQLFLVKWYGEDFEDIDNCTLYHVTKKFMVFREEEQPSKYSKKMIYTEDIGDLCIFVGHSEAFCVPANSSPGLKPNCIYFVGYNFGVYDLTTKTCTMFLTEDENPLRKLEFPYWPPPASSPPASN
ncbi:unnamed protein product [Arabidopsis lyrata]|uniref:KIB1-4 beta-propeller domain-containing protein n=1 Tax=Arabidopsis lyrata subsp. lyrata TaxID=81972 RepID=D7MFV5_ARALL|nr:uncharacterized protein LOC9305714 [Arabidopsis lyrata subsp. lyrata]EFH45902.1 hypothetical protein ARALYDRAFT_492225 [Arabidopsis lyrata subsp. lyrata]CAH8275336.1 unnamed protein product [Arabidopsis lyrata]|eukprot:XP_002869643.1 uncharacterized protein LOC9305714 [Arabidopsis lyrata subsp. lyrata]